MTRYTPEDVIKLCRQEDVKFIRLQFTDIFGIMKNVAITIDQLEKALNNEMMFDGSSINGFVRIEESDMILYPDPNSFVIFPWSEPDCKVARLICDVYSADRTPFLGDPRYALKRAIQRMNKMGYELFAGPELEFFLFQMDESGAPTTRTHDDASYFDLAPVDRGEIARQDMCLMLEKMGFHIEASHHECAPAQHEIDFKYDDALTTADNVMTFKLVVRTVAQRHNLHATFLPKPVYGVAGNGMHINQSLFQNGRNMFFDPDSEDGLSEIAHQYVAGLLTHAPGFTALTNPLVNSYKRLVPGYEAPLYIAWSAQNRSPLIRIPASRGTGTRVELRSPDPSANPYLALAATLMAGLDGIEKKMTPPEPINCTIYKMDDAELEKHGVSCLPLNIREATRAMLQDEVIVAALGEHIIKNYAEAKFIEHEEYRVQVTPWEVNNYLKRY